MNEQQALSILAQVKAALGRNYKSAIRSAWIDGNYFGQNLKKWDGPLQNIRNTFGPSWLVKAQPPRVRELNPPKAPGNSTNPVTLTPMFQIPPATPITPKHRLMDAMTELDTVVRQLDGGKVGNSVIWAAVHAAQRAIYEAMAGIDHESMMAGRD